MYRQFPISEVIDMVEPKSLPQRGTIALITAFLDESGTHGKRSASTVMGGFAGTPEAWNYFENEWKKYALSAPGPGVPKCKNGMPVIHAKDSIPKHTPYFHWTDDEHRDFLLGLVKIMLDAGIFGMVCGLHNADYAAMKDNLRHRRTVDSAYGLCFRACMGKLGMLTRTHSPGERISFILEEGHTNAGDAQRIFNRTKRSGLRLLPLGNFAIASKCDYAALQAADIMAYLTHRLFLGDGMTAARFSAGEEPAAGMLRPSLQRISALAQRYNSFHASLAAVCRLQPRFNALEVGEAPLASAPINNGVSTAATPFALAH